MEFRLLGPLEVRDGDRVLHLGGGKEAALLALLLLRSRETISIERVIDALWGERAPANAAKSVHVYISHLRKALGDDRVITRGRGYELQLADDELDLRRFEALVAKGRELRADGNEREAATVLSEALLLWRGRPLTGLEYEDFASAEVERLEQLRLEAIEERIDARLELAEATALVAEIEALVRAHPLRERLRGQLMLALYRSGRQAEALDVYQQNRRQLAEQLGLEPGRALRELEHAILGQDPALEPPPQPESVSPALPPSQQQRGGVLLLLGGIMLLFAALAATVALTRGSAGRVVDVFAGGDANASSMLAPDSIGAINPTTGLITARVPIAGTPTRLATNGRALWVGSDDSTTLAEVDPVTRLVRKSLQAGGFPSAFGVGAQSIWVLDGRRGLLSQVNPSYGVVTAQTRIGPQNPIYDVTRSTVDPTSVTVGSASIWATDGSHTLTRVDPATGKVANRFDLGTPLDGVSAGAGAIWTISGASATALRVNRSGEVTARVSIVSKPSSGSPYPMQVRIGAGYVWVLNANTATVTKIDPEQRSVATTIPIGIDRQPVRLAVGSQAAWVANGDGTLSRIDAATDTVKTIPIGHNLRDVAVAGGAVWVIAGRGLNGGTGRTSSVSDGRVRALPTSSCSPIYYAGGGHPQYLIASDLPLQTFGTTIGQMSQAIEFVLRERGFRAGPYTIGYQSCDDSTPQGTFSEERCAANARAYADDPSVIGVIGSFNSGCSASEIPILNRALNGPLAMISPTNTVVGLTRTGPGTVPGEPDRYYPSGVRNYARVSASDDAQGAADALIASGLGLRRVYVLHDSNSYGNGLAATFARAAAKLDVPISGNQSFAYGESSYSGLVARVAAATPDGVLIVGGISPDTAALIEQLRAALGPRVQILATDGFSLFPLLRKLAGAAAEGMLVSEAGVPNSELPAAGRKFVTAFAKAADETPGPYPAYAAQSAEVLLDAIARSNGTRPSITSQLFKTKVSNGILGTFSIDRNGDTTAAAISIYRIVGGVPRLLRVITPPPALIH
ncbi:MAG: hypothetical protein QOD52_1016 [Gaiellaceae bacterium]|nr:hypothetical protein [Gaiellaceae bacterium]